MFSPIRHEVKATLLNCKIFAQEKKRMSHIKIQGQPGEVLSFEEDTPAARLAELEAENERLRGERVILLALCLASEHLFRGADSIYDASRDTGPTNWLKTRDELLNELETTRQAARAAGGRG